MTATPAMLVNPTTGEPTDMSGVTFTLEHTDLPLSAIVNSARTNLGADVDVRAEHRVWGSYPKAMRAMTQPLAREERPETKLALVGTSTPIESSVTTAMPQSAAWYLPPRKR